MPLNLINNTNENILIYLVATGTDPFNIDCDNCTYTVNSNSEFQLDASSEMSIASFAQSPSMWNGGPPFVNCDSCEGGSIAVCGDPIFQYLRFAYPGIAHGLGEGCGDFYDLSFTEGNFSATWQVIGSEIYVVFND
ncbi:hypothetical protein [Haloflavibacter putidus]|uniref:Uncharacterized protein n=1 Tax=Haloflavibacter putidus TaxID=2576776 RepID=A0A507ZR17_9FLAO|nr:hypothetical protein [Haloflavibacter putidus]TQD40040.1 hypothetical protein FKR84_02260 [Haloflavibacter putidus]